MSHAPAPADRKKQPAKAPGGDYKKPDLAALFSVSPRTIDRWLARGVIPGRYSLGELVRFKREAIDAWRAANCPGI